MRKNHESTLCLPYRRRRNNSYSTRSVYYSINSLINLEVKYIFKKIILQNQPYKKKIQKEVSNVSVKKREMPKCSFDPDIKTFI